MGSWQSRLPGHRLIYCCLSTFCRFPDWWTRQRSTQSWHWRAEVGQGGGAEGGEGPGGLKRVGLREEVCSGWVGGREETGGQREALCRTVLIVLVSPTYCTVG